jgi:hypothetical protein
MAASPAGSGIRGSQANILFFTLGLPSGIFIFSGGRPGVAHQILAGGQKRGKKNAEEKTRKKSLAKGCS